MSLLSQLRHVAPEKALIVLQHIAEAQARHRLFSLSEPDDAPIPVVVGLSGGADSVCLLHALTLLAPFWNLALHVAHVDHSLRDSSSDDAAFARHMAGELGLPFHLRTLDANELIADPNGLEAAARNARYAFLHECAVELMATGSNNRNAYVAVGHHMDDQAETVLMNMIRGSGLRGLGGMSWSRPFSRDDCDQDCQIDLVRPLLGTSKAAILDYVDAYQLSFREDESNADMAYMRNRIRHETMPHLALLNPHIVDTLSRTSELCRAEADRAELLDERMLSGLTFQEQAGASISLRLDMLLDMPLAPQRGVLHCACRRFGVDMRDLGFEAIERLLAVIEQSQAATGPHTLNRDLVWTLLAESSLNPALLAIHRPDALPYEPDYPYLGTSPPFTEQTVICPGETMPVEKWSLVCERFAAAELPADWRNGRNPWRAFIDGDAVGQQLALTTAQHGMTISPLGMGGMRKSIGDIFTDRKISPAFRDGWPVLVGADTGDVVWLCGLCLSDRVKITGETAHAIGLTWKKR